MAVKQSIVDALTPVLEWLERGGEHVDEKGKILKFDMSNFSEEFYPQDEEFTGQACGTACCIAGAALQFNKHLFTEEELALVDDFVHYDAILEVAKRIGMTRQTAAKLFYASDSDVSSETKFYNYMDVGNMIFREGDNTPVRSLWHLKPEHAVVALKGYLKTGRVTWPKI